MKYKTLTVLLTGLVLTATHHLRADVVKAEDEAYSMAVSYTLKGFSMSPTNISGVAGSGERFKVSIPVVKGLDYVILMGSDKATRDTKLYVYDEVGQLLIDDLRTDKRSGVRFRASYTGDVIAQIYIVRTVGLGAYAVIVGRRGTSDFKSIDPEGAKGVILPASPENTAPSS